MARTTKRQQQVPNEPITITDDPVTWARSYQLPILYAFFIEGRKYFVQVHNRKTGKDYLWGMIAKLFMLMEYQAGRSPLVIHAFPDFKTARDTIWDGPCDKGRFIDAVFPPPIREEFSETECMLRLKDGYGTKTGPIYQLQGAKERMQSRRGPNAAGVILSEYQDHPETVYEEIYEPMIESNRGWAAFIGTPHGKNHLFKKYEYAKKKAQEPGSKWFASFATCETTKRDAPGEDGTYVMPPEKLAELRERGTDEGLLAQEYLCSFETSFSGAIFGAWLAQAKKDKRVTRVVREVNHPVGCCLDIGRSDGTAIWFYQTLAREVRLIDYLAFRASHIHEMSAADYAVKRIKDMPYLVTRIILPHDADVKGYSASKSTAEVFRQSFPDTRVMEKIPVEQGIQMVGQQFPQMIIDEEKCGRDQENGLPSGLASLAGYHRARNPATDRYEGDPVHDEYCHGADALRYGAMEGFTPLEFRTPPKWTHADMAFDVFSHVRPRPQEREAEMTFDVFTAMR